MPDATLRSNLGINSAVKTMLGGNVVDSTVEVAAAATAGTEYRMMRLPLSARIHGLSEIRFDDLASSGSPTLDIGFAPVDGNFTKDVDALNDGIDCATAAGSARMVKDHANYGKQVWEFISGATAETQGFADLIVTILDAATNTGGTVTTVVAYSVD
jgi:hypothetical protein